MMIIELPKGLTKLERINELLNDIEVLRKKIKISKETIYYIKRSKIFKTNFEFIENIESLIKVEIITNSGMNNRLEAQVSSEIDILLTNQQYSYLKEFIKMKYSVDYVFFSFNINKDKNDNND